jgi:murein DD-endopeptidase MepM/ murein hydrolase activator NlpD
MDARRISLIAPLVGLALLSGMVRADSPELAAEPPAASATAPVAAAAPMSLADIERSLGDLETEEQALRTELGAVGPRRVELERRVRIRGRVLFRLVRAGMLPIGGGLDALLDHALEVDRARQGLERDSRDLSEARARTVDLGRHLDELSTRRAPLLIQKQAMAEARAALDETEDRKRAFDRAFHGPTGSPPAKVKDSVTIYGGGVESDEPQSSSFASKKGTLPLPVAGRVEIRSVTRDGAGPGLEIQAPAGAVVRAVFGGRVAFADQYDSLGPIVIVDHGDRYYTLVGNLASTEVRVGDELSAGARVGTVGDSPSGAHVYFEVRRGSAQLDPRAWLGLR